MKVENESKPAMNYESWKNIYKVKTGSTTCKRKCQTFQTDNKLYAVTKHGPFETKQSTQFINTRQK